MTQEELYNAQHDYDAGCRDAQDAAWRRFGGWRGDDDGHEYTELTPEERAIVYGEVTC